MPNKKITKLQLQEYAALWLKHTGLNDTDISDTLSVDIDTVASWTKNKKTNKTSLFINKTMGKKNQSVSIMTKEASEQSDKSSKNIPGRNMNKNIFRPNG